MSRAPSPAPRRALPRQSSRLRSARRAQQVTPKITAARPLVERGGAQQRAQRRAEPKAQKAQQTLDEKPFAPMFSTSTTSSTPARLGADVGATKCPAPWRAAPAPSAFDGTRLASTTTHLRRATALAAANHWVAPMTSARSVNRASAPRGKNACHRHDEEKPAARASSARERCASSPRLKSPPPNGADRNRDKRRAHTSEYRDAQSDEDLGKRAMRDQRRKGPPHSASIVRTAKLAQPLGPAHQTPAQHRPRGVRGCTVGRGRRSRGPHPRIERARAQDVCAPRLRSQSRPRRQARCRQRRSGRARVRRSQARGQRPATRTALRSPATPTLIPESTTPSRFTKASVATGAAWRHKQHPIPADPLARRAMRQASELSAAFKDARTQTHHQPRQTAAPAGKDRQGQIARA